MCRRACGGFEHACAAQVFTHKGDEFEAMSPMDRAVHAIADEFITEVAAETTRGCVRASMEDMISRCVQLFMSARSPAVVVAPAAALTPAL